VATETELREWRYGQTQAERLCAALLHIEGFDGVDPQAPLGGPDGTKDILCNRSGKRWVSAVHFPPTHPSFADVRSKFVSDFEGVARNGASAFAFFVNQPLSLAQPQDLSGLTGGIETEIYHLERIRGILDSPKGYGARLEFLRIPMTPEEQLALWSALNYDLIRKLLDNETRFARLEEKLDLVLARTTALSVDLLRERSSLEQVGEGALEIETPIARLSLATLCWIHRLLTEDSPAPEAVRGRLRSVQVWIGPPNAPTLVLPPPEEVVPRTRELLEWWKAGYAGVVGGSKDEVALVLAEFHHRFLSLHPFLDANGRVARVLLNEGARELLNMRVSRDLIADPGAYIAALQAADAGDLNPLVRMISASLE
jgi:fido (protein-threonine AMPylation protein)